MMQSTTTQRKDDYQLVSRLVQYAFRVFNLDMNGFFMKYCDVFDQTPAEMKKNGETLEQYEVFRKCVSVVAVWVRLASASHLFCVGDTRCVLGVPCCTRESRASERAVN